MELTLQEHNDLIDLQASIGYSKMSSEDLSAIKEFRRTNPSWQYDSPRYSHERECECDDEEYTGGEEPRFSAYVQWEYGDSSSYEHINSIDDLIAWAESMRDEY
jgi:hypothetical protein